MPQALASEERLGAVAYACTYVQSHALQFMGGPPVSAHAAENADFHSCALPFLQMAQHGLVADFRIVDQEFLFRAFDEPGQFAPGIHWANNKIVVAGRVNLAFGVRFKEPHGFRHELGIMRHKAEAATAGDIETSEVEA